MSGDIVLRPLARVPAPTSAAFANALQREAYRAESEGEVELAPGAREALTARKGELDAALGPVSRDALDRVLMSLETMIAARTDGPEGELRLRIARHDLADLPEFALRQAAEEFRRGLVGDGKLRPATGELARRARNIALPWRQERSRIERVLAARPKKAIDPDERARVLAWLATWRKPQESEPKRGPDETAITLSAAISAALGEAG